MKYVRCVIYRVVLGCGATIYFLGLYLASMKVGSFSQILFSIVFKFSFHGLSSNGKRSAAVSALCPKRTHPHDDIDILNSILNMTEIGVEFSNLVPHRECCT
jgi:hypothetical protein